MGLLQNLGIVRGDDTLAGKIFEDLFHNFFEVEYDKPVNYVKIYWDAYLVFRESSNLNEQQRRNVNGKIFEYILATLLIRENILPIFLSSKVAFVPNISYDLMLYSTDRGPICLSAKTSFRERYKQADLEAIALKYVHRRSLCYLLTLSEKDANDVNKKQIIGDVIGLDKAIYVLSEDFNDLVNELKTFNLTESPNVNIIESTQIITLNKVNSVL
jgi:hypothetical protein